MLVGQLEFQPKMKLPEMRQLDQRVSVRCSLNALNRDGVAGYITHRLGFAGGASDRIEFTAEAVDEIYRVLKGVPRVINLVCARALQEGLLARSSSLGADIVSSAAGHLGLGGLTPRKADAPLPREDTPFRPEVAAEGEGLSPAEVHDLQVLDLSEEVFALSAVTALVLAPETPGQASCWAGGSPLTGGGDLRGS